MTLFPTRILLATDGSEEAELAARTAVALAGGIDAELASGFEAEKKDFPRRQEVASTEGSPKHEPRKQPGGGRTGTALRTEVRANAHALVADEP
jgi:nucleotide-binding universal stress UspA family protein